MGTTSEKLTYLNTTKGKIKDSINLTGANITTEPFRQYSTKLQDAYVDIINNGTSTLYSNFPKVNSEGTSLTLNNTYQAPMVNVVKGNTSQYTSQDYNLYDFMNNDYNNEGNLIVTKLSNGYMFTNRLSSIGRIIFSNANVDSSKNYVISFEINNPSSKLTRLGWSGSSKTVETRETSGKITGVLTGMTTSAFSIYIEGNSTIIITNLMYYEGTDTTKAYEPYTNGVSSPSPNFSQNVNVGSGDNKIDINGKNRLKLDFSNDSSTVAGLTFSHTDSTFSLSGTATDTYKIFNLTSLPNIISGETYTLSANITGTNPRTQISIYFRDANNNNVTSIIINTPNVTKYSKILDLTDVTNATFVLEGLQNNQSYNLTCELQLEKGEEKTTFTPYQDKDTYNIDLPVENLYYMNYNDNTTSFHGTSITSTKTGFSITGTSDTTTGFTLTNRYVTLKAGTYTLSLKNTSPIQIRLSKSDYSVIVTLPIGSKSVSFTLNEQTNVSLTLVLTNGTTYNETNEVMIEKGSKANSYTPYGTTPIELCKIGNYQDLFKRSTGKNLAPINLESETYNTLQITNNNNGTFTLLGNPTGSFGRDIATNLTLKAGTYTISANAMPSGLYIALDNEADTQLSSGTLSKTFTLASDTTYTSLGIWFTKNKDYDVTIKLQIEEGSSVTEWQPMNGWYLHKEIGKYTFTGNESITLSQTADVFYINNAYTNALINDVNVPLCTIFRGASPKLNASVMGYNTPNNYTALDSGTNKRFYFHTNVYSTPTDLATGLTGKSIYWIYETPTSEGIPSNLIKQIEQFYQAQSKNNQTNISQINNDLGFIISASALKKG